MQLHLRDLIHLFISDSRLLKRIEKILFLIILLILILSAVQKEFQLFEEVDLAGDFTPAEMPEFSVENWYSGVYQANLDQYLNDNNGFNHFLIRLNNQIDYSFYKYIHADGVIQGKDKELFEYDYIRSYTGLDYLGEDLIDRKIRQLKFLQNYLKDSLNIDLVFVLEPGKASFYPELIPEKYLRNKKPINNYREIINKGNAYGVKYINLNKWFTQLKQSAPYPLYPQHGTHWSIYGMSLAADSLLKYIEHTRNISLREVYIDSMLIEKKARRPDYDMADAMNLLFRLKEKKPLAYPVYRFEEDVANKDFPMVLTVGDSYYWNIYNTRIPHEVFKNEPYYYFGKLVYPDYYHDPTFVKDLNIREEVEKQDMILLMTTERFLHKFDWHFVDRLYSIYGVSSAYEKVYEEIFSIVSNDDWFSATIDKAKSRNVSLEEMLMIDGKYLFQKNDPLNYAIYFGVSDYENLIRLDEAWLDEIHIKAKEKNIRPEEMIRMDAEYMLSENNPVAYQKYLSIQRNKEIILNDTVLLNETKKEAAYYFKSLESMLKVKAEQMMNQ